MMLHSTLAAHLCGTGMAVATIVALVPAVVTLMRAFV
jgi:hypothetical protein